MIDVTTLFVAIIIVNFSLALIIAGVSIHVDRSPIAMSAAQACSGMAFVLFSLTGQIDSVFSVIVGNMLMIAVFALAGEGLYLFRRERAPHALLWAPVVIIGLLFTQLMDNITARTMIGAAIICVQCLHLIVITVGIRLRGAGRGRLLLIVCFATVGSINLGRLVALILGDEPVSSITAPGLLQLMTFLPALAQSLLMAVGVIVMEKERAQSIVQEMALHDPLTGLANRRLLYEQLQQAFARSASEHKYGAVILIDLDEFKPVNDRYGHAIGDLLLQSVADRIRASVREGDTIARLGGDEFVVVLQSLEHDVNNAQTIADAIAGNIHQRIAEPHSLLISTDVSANTSHVQLIECSCSTGISLFIGRDCSPDKILNQADKAMYRAKNRRGNKLSTFSE